MSRVRAVTADRAPGPSSSARVAVVAAGLSLGPVAALGLARFAYSLLLPAMKADLGWSFAQAGTMNTANALGYLAGAVVSGPLLARAEHRRPYLVGFAVTALSLLASGATGNFAVLLALRLAAGIAGAVVFVAGAGLVARLVADLSPGRSAILVSAYTAGGGLGIVISSGVVTPLAGFAAGEAWRWGWLALAAVSLLALAASAPAALAAAEPPSHGGGGILNWPVRSLWPTMVSYGLFGAGYIAYVTFIVSYVKGEGMGSASVAIFWAVLGASAVGAAFGWGPVLGRLHGGRGPGVVLAVLVIGAALPVGIASPAGDFASAVVFGAAFLAVPAAVINLARRSLSPAHAAPAITALTVCFGIGQSIGPVLAGILSDGPAGVRTGLYLAVALLAAALVVALAQRPTRPEITGTEPVSKG